MALTPSDVEQMTFSTALRGYDLNEVDDFLDQVVVTIRDLQAELEESKARSADTAPAGAGATTDEAAVGRVLVAAQKAADQLLADAKDEAARLVEAARSEADSFETDREARKAAAEAEMAELSARIADVRTQLARLATEVADRLDAMDAEVASVGGAEGSEGPSMEDEDETPGEPVAATSVDEDDGSEEPDESSEAEGETMAGAADVALDVTEEADRVIDVSASEDMSPDGEDNGVTTDNDADPAAVASGQMPDQPTVGS